MSFAAVVAGDGEVDVEKPTWALDAMAATYLAISPDSYTAQSKISVPTMAMYVYRPWFTYVYVVYVCVNVDGICIYVYSFFDPFCPVIL